MTHDALYELRKAKVKHLMGAAAEMEMVVASHTFRWVRPGGMVEEIVGEIDTSVENKLLHLSELMWTSHVRMNNILPTVPISRRTRLQMASF